MTLNIYEHFTNFTVDMAATILKIKYDASKCLCLHYTKKTSNYSDILFLGFKLKIKIKKKC